MSDPSTLFTTFLLTILPQNLNTYAILFSDYLFLSLVSFRTKFRRHIFYNERFKNASSLWPLPKRLYVPLFLGIPVRTYNFHRLFALILSGCYIIESILKMLFLYIVFLSTQSYSKRTSNYSVPMLVLMLVCSKCTQ